MKKYVCLKFEEVKVKERLVYNKDSMEIIGFVDIGDIVQRRIFLKLQHGFSCYDKRFVLNPSLSIHTVPMHFTDW